jgi:spermidine/putrescine transport system substrate-binding protein
MNDEQQSGEELRPLQALQALKARPLSRRRLLQRAAGLGALAVIAPMASACGTAASPSSASATSTAAAPQPSATPGTSAPTVPTAAPPTPQPTPEAELFVYNYADYIGDTTIADFEAKYGVKVTYDFFDTYDTMTAKIADGHSGYDVTFVTSVDVPGFFKNGLVQPLDMALIPNRANLAAEWANPGYDPGNAHSMPYMWWTTGIAYDSARVSGEPTSWKALWDPAYKGHLAMLDDYREAFAAALIQLGFSANTVSDTELDAALALLEQQKPLLRTYTTDDIGVLASGDVWVCHAWAADARQAAAERPSVKYYLPEEGAIRGSDAMVMLAGAQHPVAAQLFINFMLDAEVSAANTNKIGYMGPNEAARTYIDPAILSDPSLNPGKAAIAKLQEMMDLGPDLAKYHDRWSKLRAGA